VDEESKWCLNIPLHDLDLHGKVENITDLVGLRMLEYLFTIGDIN
jgi:hypothetical protein